MIPDHIFERHHDHEVEIDQSPMTRKGRPSSHYAALRCVTCDRHLKFMSGSELVALGLITQAELDEYREIKHMTGERLVPNLSRAPTRRL